MMRTRPMIMAWGWSSGWPIEDTDLRGVILIALLALGACDPQGAGAPSDGSIAVPENAIQVGDEYYMVPLVQPVQGCRAYRPFSPTRRVQQAIHYLTADGRFVMDRSQAQCD